MTGSCFQIVSCRLAACAKWCMRASSASAGRNSGTAVGATAAAGRIGMRRTVQTSKKPENSAGTAKTKQNKAIKGYYCRQGGNGDGPEIRVQNS